MAKTSLLLMSFVFAPFALVFTSEFLLGFSVQKSEYSSSVIAFYLCSNRRWPQLAHHNVFLSVDWEASWDSAFGKLPGGELGERYVS